MINSIKNKITPRKGFIISVISLVIFNLILVGVYYGFFLNKEINIHHSETQKELTKEIEKLEELRNKKTEQIIKRKAMESYLKAFIEAPEYLEEWSEPLFHLYIEKVLVFEDSKLEFIFKNGSKIKVDISKTLC